MAIRRKTTPRPSSGGNRITAGNVGGGGVKALQNTVWEWFIPTAPMSPVLNFSLIPYAGTTTGPVTLEDVIGMLGSGSFSSCNFPVYPQVDLNGLLLRTNIPEFVQYAGAPLSDIPLSLAESVQIQSDKAKYIGCDNGSANVSQADIQLRTTPKIESIQPLTDTEVLVSFSIFNFAQNVFTTGNSQPFFPYNLETAQAGTLVSIDSYLNQGQISAQGIRAIYLPANKVTSPAPVGGTFNFTLA